MFSSNPLKAVQKRLSKSFQRAGEMITGIGPTQLKMIRNAIEAGDEEKAMTLYTLDKNGRQLEEFINPSEHFSTKSHNNLTLLHMAATMALRHLIDIFLAKGGNPNTLNGEAETSLHCLCSRADAAELRREILEVFLLWRGVEMDGESEKTSVNRVDDSGNTAIHYAAANGLNACVQRLIQAGAIISIVNKLQQTCCEAADNKNYRELAATLELALVFQPTDESLAEFEAVQAFLPRDSFLFLDSSSLDLSDVNQYVEEGVRALLLSMPNIQRRHAETLLDAYCWDQVKLVQDLRSNLEETLKSVNLSVVGQRNESENVAKIGSSESAEGEKSVPMGLQVGGEVEVSLVEFPEEPSTKSGSVNESSTSGEATTGELNTLVVISSADALGDQTEVDTVNMTGKAVGFGNEKTSSEVVPVSGDAEGKEAKQVGEIDLVCEICSEQMLPTLTVDRLENCTEDRDRRVVYCPAGHGYCLSCWSSFLTANIRDGQRTNLTCMAVKCGEILDASWGKILLTDRVVLDRWSEGKLRHTVDCSKYLRWCPEDGCGLIIRIASSAINTGNERGSIPQSVMCDNGHAFCLSCASTAHSPCSCGDWASWQTTMEKEFKVVGGVTNGKSGDDLANAMWVATNTKRCPRCQTPIEKDEGCNHMTCRKCRHEFCWICMQEWALHSASTGGYFQCNRFQTDELDYSGRSGSRDGNDDEVDFRDFLGGNDFTGNAHEDSRRMKAKNRRMDRFLHHFTRFQAHGESATMERNMHKETIARIYAGLVASAQGNLAWLHDTVPNPLLVDASSGAGDEVNSYFEEAWKRRFRAPPVNVNNLKGPSGPANNVFSTPNSKKPAKEGNLDGLEDDAVEAGGAGERSSVFSLQAPTFLNTFLASFAMTPSDKDAVGTSGILDNSTNLATGSANAAGGLAANKRPTNRRNKALEATMAALKGRRLRCMAFLDAGFEELIRCRYLLRGSFPFAFFNFPEEQEELLDPFFSVLPAAYTTPYRSLRSSQGGGPGPGLTALTNSQRRNVQFRMATRRQDFERLQSDLEMLVEMLSDVVARRRLRAGKNQIEQATAAAKAKRVEFEDTLQSWVASDALSNDEALMGSSSSNSNNRRSAASASRRGRPAFGGSLGARISEHQRQTRARLRAMEPSRTDSPTNDFEDLDLIMSQYDDLDFLTMGDDDVPLDAHSGPAFIDFQNQLMLLSSLQNSSSRSPSPHPLSADEATVRNERPTEFGSATIDRNNSHNSNNNRISNDINTTPGIALRTSQPPPPPPPRFASNNTNGPNTRNFMLPPLPGSVPASLRIESLHRRFPSTDLPLNESASRPAAALPGSPIRVTVSSDSSDSDTSPFATPRLRDLSITATVDSSNSTSTANNSSVSDAPSIDVTNPIIGNQAGGDSGMNEILSVSADSTQGLSRIEAGVHRLERRQSDRANYRSRPLGSTALNNNNSGSNNDNSSGATAAALRASRRSQAAEDLTALNRAILLSLQDSMAASTHSGSGAAGVEGRGGEALSEENIATLQSMGFERDAVVAALQRCGNNLDAAADFLLSSS